MPALSLSSSQVIQASHSLTITLVPTGVLQRVLDGSKIDLIDTNTAPYMDRGTVHVMVRYHVTLSLGQHAMPPFA